MDTSFFSFTVKGFRLSRLLALALLAFAVAATPVIIPVADADAKSKSRVVKKTSSSYKKKAKSSKQVTLPKVNPRYAALIIDVDNNRVLHEENADATRYPASLTKMMTLYLTFEALNKNKLTLDSTLPVSDKAASQPQTNIALKKGERISVRDLIESLVVRSANDSAMVLAEGLGNSEWNFGVMMTSKARQLGMTNTVFRNPHGLPDSMQYTTARDLSKLAIALRKHFPQYYHFFNTTDFTHKGRTYHTHNRVVENYKGADGLKTGYINASGFNLVTSAKKNGYSVVGVVMGGTTAKARDAQMVALLDKSFVRLASGKVPVSSTQFAAAPAVAPATKPAQIASTQNFSVDTVTSGYLKLPAGSEAAHGQGDTDLTTTPDTISITERPLIKPAANVQAGRIWGIQVGAYARPREAVIAAAHAMNLADKELAGGRIDVANDNARSVHRARLADLTEQQARNACKKLISQQESCFVYQTN